MSSVLEANRLPGAVCALVTGGADIGFVVFICIINCMLLKMMSLFICLHLLRHVAKDDVTIYLSTSIKVCC